jgi:N-methylhydantoinase A/oxoprolinase/acetone carboxylase beta subunit
VLERTAREFLNNSKTAIERENADWWADVRYVGQPHEVSVSVPPGPVERLYADFERRHERLFGTKLRDAEIVNIRVTVTRQVPRLSAPQFQPKKVHTAPIGERLTGIVQHPVPIFWRDSLPNWLFSVTVWHLDTSDDNAVWIEIFSNTVTERTCINA